MATERTVTPAGEALWVQTFAETWRDIARETGMRGCVPSVCVTDKWRRRRILECRELCDDMAVWAAGFRAIAENDFFTGNNERGYKADLAYVLRDQNRANVVEMGFAFQDEVAARQQRQRLEAERMKSDQEKMEKGEW